MTTMIVAMDCWLNMPTAQTAQIEALPYHARCSQAHGSASLLPWPEFSPQELVEWIYQHRPCDLVYVGQHWNHCLFYRPTGIYRLQRFRPWCRILVRPSLCRWLAPGTGPFCDRELTPADLGSAWSEIEPDLYELIGRL